MYGNIAFSCSILSLFCMTSKCWRAGSLSSHAVLQDSVQSCSRPVWNSGHTMGFYQQKVKQTFCWMKASNRATLFIVPSILISILTMWEAGSCDDRPKSPLKLPYGLVHQISFQKNSSTIFQWDSSLPVLQVQAFALLPLFCPKRIPWANHGFATQEWKC